MKKLILLATFTLFVFTTEAQSIKNISNNTASKEKKSVSTKILGNIENNIYVALTNYVSVNAIDFTDQQPEKLKITSYNKESLKVGRTKAIKGFGKKTTNPLLQNAKVSDVFIKNNKIYVVWTSDNSSESQLILQILDKDLNEVQIPKAIYKLSNQGKTYARAKLFLLLSPDGKKIIVGGEENARKKENIKLQYKVLDAGMKVLNTAQAELPYSLRSNTNNLSAEYKTDDNGVLYFHTGVKTIDKEDAYIIGKIDPKDSEFNFKVVAFEKIDLKDFDYQIMDEYLYAFGTYPEGLCTFKLDKSSFEIIEDVVFNKFDVNNIVYTDYIMTNKAKSKGSVEEYTMQQLAKNNLSISNSYLLPGNEILLVLSNLYYYDVCDKSSCRPFTNNSGIHFLKLGADGKIEWISCTAHNITYPGYINLKQPLVIQDNSFYCIPFGSETFYAINEKTGIITQTLFKEKYDYEISNVVDNQFYYVGLNKRIGTRAWITSGAFAVATGVSVVLLQSYIPLLPGVGGVYFTLRSGQKKHDVYFGKYNFTK